LAAFWSATPREFNLALQGHHAGKEAQLRSQAGWMALLLTAQTGEVVTAAQLLGEEAADIEDRTAEAAKSQKALEKKMRKAGVL
jgi:hypothetical protein